MVVQNESSSGAFYAENNAKPASIGGRKHLNSFPLFTRVVHRSSVNSDADTNGLDVRFSA